LTTKEQRQLLVEFDGASVEYPGDKSLTQLFEEQVQKTPAAIAVVIWKRGGLLSGT
jgi:non-ribosomal peptide synthetase component F